MHHCFDPLRNQKALSKEGVRKACPFFDSHRCNQHKDQHPILLHPKAMTNRAKILNNCFDCQAAFQRVAEAKS